MPGTVKLKDQIYEKILDEIMEGRYQQNDFITERELIEKYGTSKSPVREALIELCKEEVLESYPRMGYRIRPISIKELSEIIELRTILEVAALRKTFQRLDDNQIKALKNNIEEAEKIHSERSFRKHWTSNISFHMLLCSFCGNQKICAEIKRTLQFSYQGAVQYFSVSWSRRKATEAQRHKKLLEAMEKRDLDASIEILAEDIADLKRELIEEFTS